LVNWACSCRLHLIHLERQREKVGSVVGEENARQKERVGGRVWFSPRMDDGMRTKVRMADWAKVGSRVAVGCNGEQLAAWYSIILSGFSGVRACFVMVGASKKIYKSCKEIVFFSIVVTVLRPCTVLQCEFCGMNVIHFTV
jgi:hypothetical protein